MPSPNDKLSIAEATRLIRHTSTASLYRWIAAGVLPRREECGEQFLYRRDLAKLVRAAAKAPPIVFDPARARELLATGQF